MTTISSAGDGYVVLLSSSDEDDEIAEDPAVMALSSEEEVDVLGDGNPNNRKRRELISDDTKLVVESTAVSYSVVTEAIDVSDNLVLRKLLRWPRYFDPTGSYLQTCYNCGEEGHFAANCTMERQKKPCFVCGMFGHNAKCCTQKCFVCNKGGHFAKDCPNKNHIASQGPKICLRCGHSGHDMPSCNNDYSPEDLKEIQCYVCKKFGHLCCVDFEDAGSGEVSCYSCGQFGHIGLGCARPRRETGGIGSPALCYVCGEEGHFARGCTKKKVKVKRHKTDSSTPKLKRKREKKKAGSKSAPDDFGRSSKKMKNLQRDEWSVTLRKSRPKHGWVDVQDDFGYKKSKGKSSQATDRGDFSCKKSRVRGGWMADDSGFSAYSKPWNVDNSRRAWDSGWMSPATPSVRSRNIGTFASEGHYPISQSPYRIHGYFNRTPNSFPQGSNPYDQHGFSARYGSSSKNRFWRS